MQQQRSHESLLRHTAAAPLGDRQAPARRSVATAVVAALFEQLRGSAKVAGDTVTTFVAPCLLERDVGVLPLTGGGGDYNGQTDLRARHVAHHRSGSSTFCAYPRTGGSGSAFDRTRMTDPGASTTPAAIDQPAGTCGSLKK
jgi:hypothetical protein